ncbi:MAG: hypothetical protein L0H23_13385 [Luteimonas sp.]|nr:hypothetical protein [Luteimonas sp.]
MNNRKEQADAPPQKRDQARDHGDVVRPEDRIGERDHRIGKQIKREQPPGAEPGYANDDNLPDR